MSDDSIPMTWPEIGLRPHEFAGIFRMLVGEEKETLAANVVDKGLRERVKVYEGKILDGRNRYLVLVEEGIFEPEVETWEERPELFERFEGTREEALDYVWSLNAERRHDNAGQRALAAERFANLRGVTKAEAAAKLGVSERQVSSAAKVLEQGEPELVQAVEEGRLPLYLGEQMAERDPEEQREVAELPKREASAVAKQKLQDAPPLAESGPVVKAMEPSPLVMFAAAVCAVGEAGKDVDAATLNALAREHGLLADADGVLNLKREVRLAFVVARKRTNVAEGDLYGSSLFAVMTAGMVDDLDLLIEDYRQAHKVFDQAMRAGHEERAGEAKLMLAALLWHANGKGRGGIKVNERPMALVKAAVAPLGTAPMWGQDGLFEIEVDGLPALVRYKFEDWGFGPSFMFRATRFDMKFPRGGWVEVRVRFADHLGRTVAEAAEHAFAELVAHHGEAKKTTADDRVGMFYPEFINRIDPDDTYDQMERVYRGLKLVDGQWPPLPAGGPFAGQNVWPATEKDCREKVSEWRSSRRGFPKPVHLATHILLVGTRAHLVPIADFPTEGAYITENNGTWRYVDDAADPDQGHVSRRLTVVTENDVTAGESASGSDEDDVAGSPAASSNLAAAYATLLAATAEQKGKFTKAAAEPLIRAGVAANVTRKQMAEDLGHPIGTILTWTARLDLTDGSRKAAAE